MNFNINGKEWLENNCISLQPKSEYRLSLVNFSINLKRYLRSIKIELMHISDLTVYDNNAVYGLIKVHQSIALPR